MLTPPTPPPKMAVRNDYTAPSSVKRVRCDSHAMPPHHSGTNFVLRPHTYPKWRSSTVWSTALACPRPIPSTLRWLQGLQIRRPDKSLPIPPELTEWTDKNPLPRTCRVPQLHRGSHPTRHCLRSGPTRIRHGPMLRM